MRLSQQIVSQFTLVAKDIANYPKSEYSGLYKGVKWRIVRVSDAYYCGYADVEDKYHPTLSNEDWDVLEIMTHGGITGPHIGFDTAHEGDFYLLPMCLVDGTTYRTFEYVLQNIKNIIDYLLEKAKKQK